MWHVACGTFKLDLKAQFRLGLSIESSTKVKRLIWVSFCLQDSFSFISLSICHDANCRHCRTHAVSSLYMCLVTYVHTYVCVCVWLRVCVPLCGHLQGCHKAWPAFVWPRRALRTAHREKERWREEDKQEAGLGYSERRRGGWLYAFLIWSSTSTTSLSLSDAFVRRTGWPHLVVVVAAAVLVVVVVVHCVCCHCLTATKSERGTERRAVSRVHKVLPASIVH